MPTRRLHVTAVVASLAAASLAACDSDGPTTSATEPPSTTDVPATSEAPATSAAPESTDAPATTKAPATSEAPVATEAPASTEAPDTTEATERARSVAWARGCDDQPLAPPFLSSGGDVGDAVLSENADGITTATWAAGTPDEITQLIPAPDTAAFEIVAGSDELISAGGLEAAVVPVGPPVGPISVDFRDVDETCVRSYQTPGSLGDRGVEGSPDEDAVDRYTQAWLDAITE